ncbi:RebB family R body protein [Colwellia psychrerythraea]|uniref:Killing trait, RebB n=1 Tax=Colwellia psychrerythraea TaxID=28229 RepID=A0A099KB50_COLPS|nr:RebB family R body protein [Colwellia psychrerythraea]KGJ87964.1 Killing trait, RebB [Colwellia psychrerythraea]
MSDINGDTPAAANQQLPTATNNPFSNQPTGLVETTFAETLGLSMHNAITNQQSSQMTTSASVTNACARLLQTPTHISRATSPAVTEKVVPVAVTEEIEPEKNVEDAPPAKKRFNIMAMFKRKKVKPKLEE